MKNKEMVTQYKQTYWKLGRLPKRGGSKKCLVELGGDGQMEGIGQTYQ